jgi:hypothetical protein
MKPRHAAALTPESRSAQLHRGIRLEAITVIWNIAEGVIAVTVGWRLLDEIKNRSEYRVEQIEQLTSRIAGILLLALAVYITADSTRRLRGAAMRPRESLMGIAITAVSLVVMPTLGRAKLRCAAQSEARPSERMRMKRLPAHGCQVRHY